MPKNLQVQKDDDDDTLVDDDGDTGGSDEDEPFCRVSPDRLKKGRCPNSDCPLFGELQD